MAAAVLAVSQSLTGQTSMDRIRIVGGNRLNGTIPISGAKNAALPLMIASLLTSETLTLDNVPRLADVAMLKRILGNHGVDCMVLGKRPGQNGMQGESIELRAGDIVDTVAPYDLVSRMRASFWVIGPLLARMGEAKVSLPGGCAIGTRPVDLFIEALKTLGAEIDIDAGYVLARAPKGLRGARIVFPKVTVGATHVAHDGGVAGASGETVIENAAREPEIVDLAACLIKMGAKISGAGTSTIHIDGVDAWRPPAIPSCPIASRPAPTPWPSTMTGGDVLLEGATTDILTKPIEVLTSGRRRDHRHQPRHPRQAERAGPRTGRCHHRAVPGLRHRPAGAADGAGQPRRRHLAHPRDDLREPLHARAGTRPPRRRHSSRRAGGDRHRRAAS